MSMHGRIYVEKSLTLDRVRQRRMENHLKQLDSIQEGKLTKFKLRDVARSTDKQLKFHNKMHQKSIEFMDACKLFNNLIWIFAV